MSTPQTERLRLLLEPLATAAGLDLEEVAVTPAGKRRLLRVVVDCEGGVPLDALAELSRSASDALDASDVMGGAPYVLEVSSPGTDRPLTEPHHFARNRGRLVKARLADGGELVARILRVDDEGLDVEVPGVKGRKATERRLPFGEIVRARVELEFNRPGPDGAAAAEEAVFADEAGFPDDGDGIGDGAGDEDRDTGSSADARGARQAGGPGTTRTAQYDGAEDPAAADSDESPEEA